MQMFIKDSKGEPSLTATAFLIGFIIVNIKLLFSGIALTETLKFSEFSGGDYAASLAALGAIYVMRRAYPSKEPTPTNLNQGD